MGTMEKAGVAVVGAVICIIVVVGLMQKRDDGTRRIRHDEKSTSDRKAAPKTGTNRLSKNRVRRTGPAAVSKKGKKPERADTRGTRPQPPIRPDGVAAKPKGRRLPQSNDAEAALTAPRRNEKTVVQPKASAGWPRRVDVAAGDTLSGIVHRAYGTVRMLEAVVAANKGLDPDHLKIGQRIVLPRPDPAVVSRPSAKRSPAEETTAALTSSKIRRPSFITASYVKAHLATATGRKPANGRSGATSSPKTRTKTAPRPGGTYTVSAGDTLTGISKKVYGTIQYADAIMKANRDRIKKADQLRVGWVLKLPKVN